MDALLTALYLVVFFGVIGGVTYGLDSLYQAHKRGMARVRAYDARQRGNR